MKIKKNLIKRDIAGDVILVPTGKSVIEANGLYFLNDLGSFIWDILPGVESEEDIIKAVLDEYDADENIVRNDVALFLDKLRKLEVIE